MTIKTATIAPDEAPQFIRFLNIFALAPALFIGAVSDKPPKMVRVALLIAGVATLARNWKEYMEKEKGGREGPPL